MKKRFGPESEVADLRAGFRHGDSECCLRRARSDFSHDEGHSYNSWAKTLLHTKPKALADALLATYKAPEDGLVYLKQNRSGVSLRNQIAHHGHVSPATINLTANGLFLVGGGEDSAFNREIQIRSLQTLIGERATYILETANASLDTFIGEVRKFESRPIA